MGRIIDINGNPLRLEKESQTENSAALAQLRRHYSEHPTVGLTPSRAAAALKEVEQGNLIALRAGRRHGGERRPPAE